MLAEMDVRTVRGEPAWPDLSGSNHSDGHTNPLMFFDKLRMNGVNSPNIALTFAAKH